MQHIVYNNIYILFLEGLVGCCLRIEVLNYLVQDIAGSRYFLFAKIGEGFVHNKLNNTSDFVTQTSTMLGEMNKIDSSISRVRHTNNHFISLQIVNQTGHAGLVFGC